MPKLNTHCYLTRKRTNGKDAFEELHKWMDEEHEYLDTDHRAVRHDLRWIKAVEKKFSKDAVIHFLYHIIDDYEETLEKIKYKFEKEKEENESGNPSKILPKP